MGAVSAAVIATGAPANAASPPDQTREACLRYVGLEDRVLSLLDKWPVLESRLAEKYPGFLKLSLEEQALFPGGERFLEIERELDLLSVEREKLLRAVVRLKCITFDAVIAKLLVVERLIQPDDHSQAHKLVADTVTDLRRLQSV